MILYDIAQVNKYLHSDFTHPFFIAINKNSIKEAVRTIEDFLSRTPKWKMEDNIGEGLVEFEIHEVDGTGEFIRVLQHINNSEVKAMIRKYRIEEINDL
jgi:hypothetical protein